MNDSGALADDNAVDHGNDHEMAWRVEIGSETVRLHRLVEHLLGNAHHNRVIAGMKPSDFGVHCVNSPQSAHEF
ncbi:hypothetical protein [Mesorhizobium sp. CA8]|uniref:hypothetical protein n=1 Tax=Mesorhizobium sp. CA8 TaxID=2876637 RepID=UPI001CCF526E|nr:hypothetical protein [Mesorhizobium sp. CA8]